jgi:hypothetical protein
VPARTLPLLVAMSEDGEKVEISPVDREEKEKDVDDCSLPSWMRYLPRTPWNSHSVHRQFHLEETNQEIQRRRLRVQNPPRLQTLNLFVADSKKMDDRKGKKRSNEESDEQGMDSSSLEHTETRRVVKPKRNVTTSSIEEMSMLVSFCKVEKHL